MSMATFANTPDKITYFAETDYRSRRIKFGIRDDDRERHVYVIGKTGMGKSTMLENLAIQDIANGEGLCFIDPHGGTAETLLSYVPEHRVKDVIYFAPFDQEYPVALNVMEDIGRERRPLVASGLIGAFKKVWVDAWSARMEYILSNALLALLEYPGATLLGVNRIFADKNYRSLIVGNLIDPSVKAFWLDEYAKYSDKFATEATAAIQNKVGQFAANPLIRNMVGQSKSTFDIRKVMDERKILIVNLSKGRIGEGNANLVGSMLITKIYLAAMSRADVGPEVVKGLPPFYLYVDEFQSFANESFADILSEARKYKLSLTIAHQYIEQMSDEVRAAVFGNVGSMVSFRVGAYDAEVLEKEFAPAFTAEDMVNLGARQIYLKLMINGVGSSPFSATTLNRPKFPARMYTNEVIAASRAQFGRPRAIVEEEIKKWHEPIPEPPRDPNAPGIPETRKYAPGTRPLRPGPVGASAAYAGPARSATTEGAAPRPTQPLPATSREQEVFRPQPHFSGTLPSVLPPPSPAVSPSRSFTMERARPEIRSTQGEQAERESTFDQPTRQPFRDEFLKMQEPQKTPPLPPERKLAKKFPETSPHRERRGGEMSAVASSSRSLSHATPLAHLKSQPKKDKGPSTENLSSLKALIDAAFASGAKEKSETAGTTSVEGLVTRPKNTDQGNVHKKTSPILTPPSPPSLLNDDSPALAPKEVPEDVLRGVLAD